MVTISDATAAKVKQLKRDMPGITAKLQDPAVTVTFTRKGTVIAADVTLIRIRLDDRQPEVQGFNQGAVEGTIRGTAKAWAADVADVMDGDRFRWDGYAHKIAYMEPARNGVRVLHFERLGGVS